MESSILGRLFKSVFKFFFSSFLLGAVSLVGSTSFMTGKFPPDWQQIKNMLGSVQRLKDFQKNVAKGQAVVSDPLAAGADPSLGGQSPNMEMLKKIRALQAKPASDSSAQPSNNSPPAFEDPAIADIKDLMNERQKMQNLSAALSGEKPQEEVVLPNRKLINNNLAPYQGRNTANTQLVVPAASPRSVDGRLRALELEVGNLTLKIRNLNGTIMELNDKLDRMPSARR